jgi:hypothetical protein
MKKLFIPFIIFWCLANAFGNPEGRMVSPYEACENYLIVDSAAYKKHQAAWDEFSRECYQEILPTQNTTAADLFTILKHSKYNDFARKVTLEVKRNLDRQSAYYKCTASCFEGASSCQENKTKIICNERRKEVREKLKVDARKARIQLALTRSSSDLFSVTPRNVLTLSLNQRINKDLKEFEFGPMAVGFSSLTPRELTEAKRRLKADQDKVEEEAAQRGLSKKSDYVALKLVEKMEEHQDEYRDFVYSKSPMLSVLERPFEVVDGDPHWKDDVIAKASKELIHHANKTQEIVDLSLKDNILEHSRENGDDLRKGIISRLPLTTPRKELLFYVGMKSAVEEVLKKDPSLCGLATTMYKRLKAKEDQISYATTGATFAPLGIGYGAKLVKGLSTVAGAVTGISTSSLVGLGLAAGFPIESRLKYDSTIREAALGLRTGEDVDQARSKMKMAVGLAYVSGGTLLAKEASAITGLGKGLKTSNLIRNKTVGLAGHNSHQWLTDQIDNSYLAKNLSAKEILHLKEKASLEFMDSMASDIKKIHPHFFDNKDNTDFFVKAASISMKKMKGDPVDLPEKIRHILLDVNKDAIKGSWNPNARKGLLTVIENTKEVLRETFKKDPATYAKFTVDPVAKQKVLIQALKRSGAKQERINALTRCLQPGK